jgi:zinc D-Ala-D-Ala dipeptidase
MKYIFLLMFFSAGVSAIAVSQIETADKIVITIGSEWESNGGTMYMFDRKGNGWSEYDEPFSVSFGKNGMAWDDKNNDYVNNDNIKKEGDDKSPAGIFAFGALYGFESIPPAGVLYPYHQITPQTKCIDDGSSKLYNQVTEEDSLTKDWKSDEEMHKIYPDYKYVLIVEHNKENVPGNGSCIFFHINNIPTTGCTSMDEDSMLKFLRWLDPGKKVMLIQLPRSEYDRLRVKMKLPSLSPH